MKAYVRKVSEGRFRGSRKAILFAASVIAGHLLLAPPAARPAPPRDQHVVMNHTIDKAAIENLQRWVSAGHESWCKDARMVASQELLRIAPDFAGGQAELQALSLQTEFLAGTRAIFTWTPLDGRATYRVTVERYAWLLPIAGERDCIIWVPARIEIVAHP